MVSDFTRRAALATFGSVLAAPALAQRGRTITLMHGFPAGTNVDVVARLIAESLGPRLGQTIVVEPRPGAGGTTGAAALARSPADGSVLGVVAGGHAIAAALYNKLPFDPVADFTFIGMVQEFPFVFATYPDHPAKNIQDLIRIAGAEPGKLNCGTGGNGTGMHLAFELFLAMGGIKIQHVPYRGSPPAVLDLLAKRLDLVVTPPSAVIPQIRSGDLRVLGVTTSKPFPLLPEAPTVAETVKGYEVNSWIGLAAPAGLPRTLVDSLNADLQAVLSQPAIAQRLRDIEAGPSTSTPEEFRARVEEDVKKWIKVVQDANIPRI